jgi:hypothetical protein
MKIKFNTQKVTSLSDYFNVGFHKDIEEDYSFCIMLFGRDYSWSFFKKDSEYSFDGWDEEEDDL